MEEMSITLQEPQLVARLQQVAATEHYSAEALLQKAVTEYLDKIAQQKIRAESEAFEAMHAELLQTHRDHYVAVHEGQVVDADTEARALYLRIRERYGAMPVLIRQVTAEARPTLVFRSPRLRRTAP